MKSPVACLLLLAACFMFGANATYYGNYHRSGYGGYGGHTGGYTAPKKSVVHVTSGKTSGYLAGHASHGGGGGGAGADVLAALQSVKQQLAKVAKRGCLNGIVKAVICDQNNYDPTVCTHQYVGTGLEKIVEIDIEYDNDYADDFDEYPVVTTGLSGITGAIDKDCEVEATYITKRGFKMRLILSGALPFELNLFWMACDARNGH